MLFTSGQLGIDPVTKELWVRTLDYHIRRNFGVESNEEELFVQSPADDLYIYYLVMRIDLEHGDQRMYYYSSRLFRYAYQKFASCYVKTHSQMLDEVPMW